MFKKMLVLMMGSNLVLHMVGHWQEHYHSRNISFNYHQMTTLIMNGELLQNIQHSCFWLNHPHLHEYEDEVDFIQN